MSPDKFKIINIGIIAIQLKQKDQLITQNSKIIFQNLSNMLTLYILIHKERHRYNIREEILEKFSHCSKFLFLISSTIFFGNEYCRSSWNDKARFKYVI